MTRDPRQLHLFESTSDLVPLGSRKFCYGRVRFFSNREAGPWPWGSVGDLLKAVGALPQDRRRLIAVIHRLFPGTETAMTETARGAVLAVSGQVAAGLIGVFSQNGYCTEEAREEYQLASVNAMSLYDRVEMISQLPQGTLWGIMENTLGVRFVNMDDPYEKALAEQQKSRGDKRSVVPVTYRLNEPAAHNVVQFPKPKH
jgi:hypothetical protein